MTKYPLLDAVNVEPGKDWLLRRASPIVRRPLPPARRAAYALVMGLGLAGWLVANVVLFAQMMMLVGGLLFPIFVVSVETGGLRSVLLVAVAWVLAWNVARWARRNTVLAVGEVENARPELREPFLAALADASAIGQEMSAKSLDAIVWEMAMCLRRDTKIRYKYVTERGDREDREVSARMEREVVSCAEDLAQIARDVQNRSARNTL